MKTTNILVTALAILGLAVLATPAIQAQICDGTGTHFVDLDGDGFNDNAPDHDGDGIPNGLDADYIKNARDGSGYQMGKLIRSLGQGMAQNGTMTKLRQFNSLQASNGTMFRTRLSGFGGGLMSPPGTGICDGTGGGGSGTGICDGTGGGGSGTGVCDGTGPKGTRQRGGN